MDNNVRYNFQHQSTNYRWNSDVLDYNHSNSTKLCATTDDKFIIINTCDCFMRSNIFTYLSRQFANRYSDYYSDSALYATIVVKI